MYLREIGVGACGLDTSSSGKGLVVRSCVHDNET
jgi:hypothetical protein